MTVIGEMQLSIHKRYLRTNTQNTIVVNSTQYESHIRRRYSNLEIYLLPLTDTVQLPVNGPCKSRYLAKNVICTTVLSFNIQLYHCIPVFPRLYLYNTYLPNTDYTDYTDNRVVFIIWTDNVNAICTTTISSNIQLWYCIAVFPRLYPCNTYLPNTDYTNYTGYRVVFNHLHRKRWVPSTGIHFFHLAVGTSSRSAHSFTESK